MKEHEKGRGWNGRCGGDERFYLPLRVQSRRRRAASALWPASQKLSLSLPWSVSVCLGIPLANPLTLSNPGTISMLSVESCSFSAVTSRLPWLGSPHLTAAGAAAGPALLSESALWAPQACRRVGDSSSLKRLTEGGAAP